MDRLPNILIALLCLLLAIACCWFYMSRRRALLHWTRTEATVTENRTHTASGSDVGNRRVYYEFRDATGKHWEGLTDDAPKGASPGTKIEIAYNPDDPRASMFPSVSTLPLAFAGVAVIIGALVFFAA